MSAVVFASTVRSEISKAQAAERMAVGADSDGDALATASAVGAHAVEIVRARCAAPTDADGMFVGSGTLDLVGTVCSGCREGTSLRPSAPEQIQVAYVAALLDAAAGRAGDAGLEGLRFEDADDAGALAVFQQWSAALEGLEPHILRSLAEHFFSLPEEQAAGLHTVVKAANKALFSEEELRTFGLQVVQWCVQFAGAFFPPFGPLVASLSNFGITQLAVRLGLKSAELLQQVERMVQDAVDRAFLTQQLRSAALFVEDIPTQIQYVRAMNAADGKNGFERWFMVEHDLFMSTRTMLPPERGAASDARGQQRLQPLEVRSQFETVLATHLELYLIVLALMQEANPLTKEVHRAKALRMASIVVPQLVLSRLRGGPAPAAFGLQDVFLAEKRPYVPAACEPDSAGRGFQHLVLCVWLPLLSDATHVASPVDAPTIARYDMREALLRSKDTHWYRQSEKGVQYAESQDLEGIHVECGEGYFISDAHFLVESVTFGADKVALRATCVRHDRVQLVAGTRFETRGEELCRLGDLFADNGVRTVTTLVGLRLRDQAVASSVCQLAYRRDPRGAQQRVLRELNAPQVRAPRREAPEGWRQRDAFDPRLRFSPLEARLPGGAAFASNLAQQVLGPLFLSAGLLVDGGRMRMAKGVQVHDIATGVPAATLELGAEVWALAAGRQGAFVGGDTNKVKWFDPISTAPLGEFPGPCGAKALALRGGLLFVQYVDQSVRAFSLEGSQQPVLELPGGDVVRDDLKGLATHEDCVLSAAQRESLPVAEVRVHRIETGELVRTLSLGDLVVQAVAAAGGRAYIGVRGSLRLTAMAAVGSLAKLRDWNAGDSGSGQPQVLVFDLATGLKLKTVLLGDFGDFRGLEVRAGVVEAVGTGAGGGAPGGLALLDARGERLDGIPRWGWQ